MNRPIILDMANPLGPEFPNPDSCPNCHSSNVVPIAYGFLDDETTARAMAGEIILGGCTPDEPSWHCKDCNEDWPKQRLWPTEEEYLTFRTRKEQHLQRPDILLRSKLLALHTRCAELVEKHIRVPLLLQFGQVTIHRKLRLKSGVFQYMIRFGDVIVRVRPSEGSPVRFHASCMKRQPSAAVERRSEAAALLFIERRAE